MKSPTKKQLVKIINTKGLDAARQTLDKYIASCHRLLLSAIQTALGQTTAPAKPGRKKKAVKKKAKKKTKKKTRKKAKKAVKRKAMKKVAKRAVKKKAKKKVAKKAEGKSITEANRKKLLSVISKDGISAGEAGIKFAYPQKYAATKKALIAEGKILSKKEQRSKDKRSKEYLYLP